MSRTGSMRSTQKIVISLLVVCFLVLGLLVAVLLVRQQQDVRSDAAVLIDAPKAYVESTFPTFSWDPIGNLVIKGTIISSTLSLNNTITLAVLDSSDSPKTLLIKSSNNQTYPYMRINSNNSILEYQEMQKTQLDNVLVNGARAYIHVSASRSSFDPTVSVVANNQEFSPLSKVVVY